jgi:hypothetical protein
VYKWFKKRPLHVSTFVLVILLLLATGAQVAEFVIANPIYEVEWTDPPIISVHSPGNNMTYSADNAVLNFTVSRPEHWLVFAGGTFGRALKQLLISIAYQLDGNWSDIVPANYSDLQSPFNYFSKLPYLEDGVHTLKVHAYASGWRIEADGAWETQVYINSSSDLIYFKVDNTPPTVSLLSLEGETYYTTNVPLDIIVDESASQITYSLDGQENVTVTGNCTLTNLPYGVHNLIAYVKDTAENVGTSQTATFTVAKEPEPFPITLVTTASAISIAIVGAATLIIYLKKRKSHNK